MQSTSDNQEGAENEEGIWDEEDEEDVAGEKENSEALECRVSTEKVLHYLFSRDSTLQSFRILLLPGYVLLVQDVLLVLRILLII
jgi:hypothetical protein